MTAAENLIVNDEDDAIALLAKTMGMATEDESVSKNKTQAKFEFDEKFQSKIAAFSLRSTQFARRTEGLIEPSYFENEAHAFLVDTANRYFKQYRSVPDAHSVFIHFLKTRMDASRMRNDFRKIVFEEYKALAKEKLADLNYIADQVGSFARHQAVQNAMLESVELLEKGDVEAIARIMNKALRTSANDDFVEIDYWNDIDRRTQYRKDMEAGLIERRGISTGIKKLDNLLYHKGWGRKELTALLGGAKKGKSTGLGYFSVLSSLGGYDTLYLSLEVAGDIIAERNDASNSKVPMKELNARADEVANQVALKAGSKRGHLKIIEMPSGSLSPSGLRRIIERYKAEGIQFDCIIVDYADIMKPDVFTTSEIENSKQIWLGLRAIAYEEDAAVLTATQTNREGFKNDTAKAEHAAEDFNKIRIADLVISINRNDEEKDRGEARLYFAASRNQAGEFTLGIKQSLETMEFITGITGVS